MPICFDSLPLLPGSAAGAAALKSGDASPCSVGKLSIALATRGRAPAADPPQKSFSLVGFSRFSGSGVDKKRVKFEDAFWRSQKSEVPKIGKKYRFDTFFGRFFAFRKSQNAVNYNIFAF